MVQTRVSGDVGTASIWNKHLIVVLQMAAPRHPTTPHAGVDSGLKLLEPIKDACPAVSWADLIQLAGAVAIEVRVWLGVLMGRAEEGGGGGLVSI
jgi:hypothetical protein